MFKRRLWSIPPSEQWQRKQDEPRLAPTDRVEVGKTDSPATPQRLPHDNREYETCPQPPTHVQGLILL